MHDKDEKQHSISVSHSQNHTLETLLDIIQALSTLPVNIDPWTSDKDCLFSPEVQAVGQYLIEQIGNQLQSDTILFLAVEGSENYLGLIASRGLKFDPQAYGRLDGRDRLVNYLDEAAIARLYANEVVTIPPAALHIPDEFPPLREDIETFLLAPMLVANHLVGMFVVAQTGNVDQSRQEDIMLVKASAMLIVFIVRRIYAQNRWAEAQANALIQQETHQRINTFLHLASHKLKTPITTIMGNLQLVQRRLQRWKNRPYEMQEEAAKIVESLEQPLEEAIDRTRIQAVMINEMIDDALIQNQKLVLYPGIYNFIDLAVSALKEWQYIKPQRQLIVKLPENVDPLLVEADAHRISQVIHHYLANADTYSPPDQPVTVYITKEQEMVYFSVEDQGRGIPSEEQEHIWERFYRARGYLDQQQNDLSFGLGLYLSRTFVELHNGEVGIKSVPGHGSIFWFTLPLLPSRLEKKSETAASAQQ